MSHIMRFLLLAFMSALKVCVPAPQEQAIIFPQHVTAPLEEIVTPGKEEEEEKDLRLETASFVSSRSSSFGRSSFTSSLASHVMGCGVQGSSCFEHLRPSEEMKKKLLSSVQVCVKASVKKAAAFKKEMPCQEVRSLILEGLKEEQEGEDLHMHDLWVDRETIEPMAMQEEELHEPTIRRRRRRQAAETASTVVVLAETTYKPKQEEEKEMEEEELPLEEEETAEDLETEKETLVTTQLPEFDLGGLEGIEEFEFISDMLNDNLVETFSPPQTPQFRQARRLMHPGEPVPQFQPDVLRTSTGEMQVQEVLGTPRSLFQVLLMQMMFRKLRDSMQECVAKDMGFVNDLGEFEISAFRKFISMAFEDDDNEDLQVLLRLAEECAQEIEDVPSDRRGSFSIVCIQDKVRRECVSRSGGTSVEPEPEAELAQEYQTERKLSRLVVTTPDRDELHLEDE
ncbi:uncharacterized protein LOC143026160 [Oratosquilla oratoria]|uniref:uncharacterized protein LOC143026160 n=1 Tax=Oratosquilla oratoria TaxID=337810 RepID=UPI003F76F489